MGRAPSREDEARLSVGRRFFLFRRHCDGAALEAPPLLGKSQSAVSSAGTKASLFSCCSHSRGRRFRFLRFVERAGLLLSGAYCSVGGRFFLFRRHCDGAALEAPPLLGKSQSAVSSAGTKASLFSCFATIGPESQLQCARPTCGSLQGVLGFRLPPVWSAPHP